MQAPSTSPPEMETRSTSRPVALTSWMHSRFIKMGRSPSREAPWLLARMSVDDNHPDPGRPVSRAMVIPSMSGSRKARDLDRQLHRIEASVLIGEEVLATGQKLAAYYEATPTML